MLNHSNESAARAPGDAHSLCVMRSGDNPFADIPLSVSISSMAVSGGARERQGQIVTRGLEIRPDLGRMLNPELVSDDVYSRIWSNEAALAEGEGAARLFSMLSPLCGDGSSPMRAVRYSMRGRRDSELVRNFLWREGLGGLPVEALQDSLRIVDMRHALMVLAAVCRARGTGKSLPRGLRDYDLDPRRLTAAQLSDSCGVPARHEGSESAALLGLVSSARDAAQTSRSAQAARDQTTQVRFLGMLGETLDHLAGAAAMPGDKGATGNAMGVSQTVPPAAERELTPSHVGLLLYKGVWTPVVRPRIGNRNDGSSPCLYSLPEGRPLARLGGTSRPLILLDFLASASGWDADADKRLRRLCVGMEAARSFQSLREAFLRVSGAWPPPRSVAPVSPLKANNWTRIEEYPPNAGQYAAAGKVVEAIGRGDVEGVSHALGEFARGAAEGCPKTASAAQLLLGNLRLIASRADLLGDSRKAWLRQMALLYDPQAWPGGSPSRAQAPSVLFLGDGPVARHNRIAISSRSAWGIPASKDALSAVSQPPPKQEAILKWWHRASGGAEVLPAKARASQRSL